MFTKRNTEVHYVYVFRYKKNGDIKYYIGQTQDVLKRLRTHRTNYKNMLMSIEICGLRVVPTRLDALELESILQELYVQCGDEALKEGFIVAGGSWCG